MKMSIFFKSLRSMKALGLEVAHLAGDARRQRRGIEAGDRATPERPATRLSQFAWMPMPSGVTRPEAGHHHAAACPVPYAQGAQC